MSAKLAAGIDLGGTRIKSVLVTPDGEVLRRAVHSTSDQRESAVNPQNWIATIAEVLAEFRSFQPQATLRVGVAAPGLASHDERSIAHMPGRLEGLENLVWADALQSKSPIPVLNDAHAALMGEAWVGAAKNLSHAVLLTLGTGVGGAILIDGKLYKGATGRGGHLGHLSLDPFGAPDICGAPGSLEDQIGECTVTARTDGQFRSTKALVAAADASDEFARKVWLRSIRCLAAALVSLINTLDPQQILLAGGITAAGESLLGPLNEELASLEWRPGGHQVPVIIAKLGEDAGALGAARRALEI